MSNLGWLNVTAVRSMDDFPAPVAWVITLTTWTYSLQAVLITTDRFVIPDWAVVQLRGVDAFIGWIVYTWTWDMFTFSDILSLSFTETFMTAPLASKLYNVTNISLSAAQIFIINTAIFDVPDWGLIERVTQFTGYFNAFTDIWQGIVLESVAFTSFLQTLVNGWKNEVWANMFTFQWTTWDLLLSAMPFSVGSNENMFDFKSTWTYDNMVVNACTLSQSSTWWIFAAWSEDETNINFNFSANSNMPESIAFVNMTLASAQTVAITSIWVPVVVNDTTTGGTNIWTELWNTSRFTFNASTGRLTYIWLEEINVAISASASIEKSWGWADIISTLIAKNWTAISESISTTQNNTPTSVGSIADVALVTWDFLELMVQNDSTTVDIDIGRSNFITKD